VIPCMLMLLLVMLALLGIENELIA